MKPEQEFVRVQAESAAKDAKIEVLEAKLAAALALIEQLTSRLKAVEGQPVKASHNSSKPPSSLPLRRLSALHRPFFNVLALVPDSYFKTSV